MSPVSWPWLTSLPFTVSPSLAPPPLTVLLSPAPSSLYILSLPSSPKIPLTIFFSWSFVIMPLSRTLAVVSFTLVSANFVFVIVLLARWFSVLVPQLVPNTFRSLMSCWR